MPNSAGVRPINPIDPYTRKLLTEFEAAVFERALAMAASWSEDDAECDAKYTVANRAYLQAKSALFRRISKLTATPSLDPTSCALDPEPETEQAQ